MSFVPSRPSAPDSEAQRFTDPSHDDPAARVRTLARRILQSCGHPVSDPLPGLAAQFDLLDGIFHELLFIDAELHGTTGKAGLSLALRAQQQALAAAIVHVEIRNTARIRKI